MNIEIITTPNEALKESGFGILKSCESVFDAISYMGHNVVLNVCRTKENLQETVKRKPDLVILAVKYLSFKNENDIWLSEYFKQAKINFTGSSREVLKFDSDKVLAKLHLKNKGVKTAKYFTAVPGEYRCEDDLPIGFPLFLKPIDAANGNGIDDQSFVKNFKEFESKVLSLHQTFNLPVLVEEYLDGREFTVAVIETKDKKLILSPIEIIPMLSTKGLRILGHKAKTEDTEELKKVTDTDLKNRLIHLASDAFIGLGARDFGRIDIKTNRTGECFFMEANLVPGMTMGSSYFPKSCEIGNSLTYTETINLMLSEGLSRARSLQPALQNHILSSSACDSFSDDLIHPTRVIPTLIPQSQPDLMTV